MNSYQKLKQKVALLEQELELVCLHPDTLAATMAVNKVKFRRALEKSLMFGGPSGTFNMPQNFADLSINSEVDLYKLKDKS